MATCDELWIGLYYISYMRKQISNKNLFIVTSKNTLKI
jgi:hypothetical protein